MGFFSWLARKGVAGETARTIGQQYLMLKARGSADSETGDEEIFETILAARHAAKPYTLTELARLQSSAVYSESVADFVLGVVLAESNVGPSELPEGQMNNLREAITRELRGLGLS